MKVVIAVDSFKGSLSSLEVGQYTKKGITKVYKDADIRIVSMADGGEGTVDSLIRESIGEIKKISVNGPLLKQVNSFYGIMGDGKTAVIEMAAASGITLIQDSEKNPMLTTTFGTGELIKDALLNGCKNFIIGIGGSATNDMGMGMLQALGFEFYDENDILLKSGGKQLSKVKYYKEDNILPELKDSKFTIACDVDNPLYGKNGAAYIYGRQKGADNIMMQVLDLGMKHFSNIIKSQSGKDISSIPGAGAAGGLGGGFLAFLNSELKPGIEIVIEQIKLSEIVKDADFVITGEGQLDNQTSMGKTPVGVANCAKQFNIPVIAIAGSIADGAEEVHNCGIDSFFSVMNRPITLVEAMNPVTAGSFIEKNVEEIFRLIKVVK